jgi:hypothetical protein
MSEEKQNYSFTVFILPQIFPPPWTLPPKAAILLIPAPSFQLLLYSQIITRIRASQHVNCLLLHQNHVTLSYKRHYDPCFIQEVPPSILARITVILLEIHLGCSQSLHTKCVQNKGHVRFLAISVLCTDQSLSQQPRCLLLPRFRRIMAVPYYNYMKH